MYKNSIRKMYLKSAIKCENWTLIVSVQMKFGNHVILKDLIKTDPNLNSLGLGLSSYISFFSHILTLDKN